MPCLADACKMILGMKAAKKIREISLPNDTVARHITVMNEDLHHKLL
jgi:hypothetical protein